MRLIHVLLAALLTGPILARGVGKPTDRVFAVAFCGDNLVVDRAFSGVQLVDRTSGKPLRTFQGPQSGQGLALLDVAPDGQRLLTAAGGSLKLWEVSTGRLLATQTPVQYLVSAARFSPDGKWVVSPSDKPRGLAVYSAANLALKRHIPLTGDRLVDVAWLGSQVLTSGSDGELRLSDIEQGRQVRHISVTYKNAHFSQGAPGGEFVFEGGEARSVDPLLRLGKPLREPDQTNFYCMRCGPAGQVVTGGLGSLQVWVNGSPHRLKDPQGGPDGEVASVSFSADGKLAASGGYDTVVRIWDVKSGKLVARMPTR